MSTLTLVVDNPHHELDKMYVDFVRAHCKRSYEIGDRKPPSHIIICNLGLLTWTHELARLGNMQLVHSSK